MRKKLVSAVDVFHDVRGMNDIQIVELARAEKLDIAIDLERLYAKHAWHPSLTDWHQFRSAILVIQEH